MGVLGVNSLANAEIVKVKYAFDYPSQAETKKYQTSKKVAGYTVQCHSLGDLIISKKFGNKVFNFCTESNTKLMLNKAKALKEPNFAGELKIVKISPTNEYKPKAFADYALVAIVDEKDKKIIVNEYAYGVKYPIIDKGDSDFVYFNTIPSKGYNKYQLGDLYSSKKSFMFSFENPEWANWQKQNQDDKSLNDLLQVNDYSDFELGLNKPILSTIFLGKEGKKYKFDNTWTEIFSFQKELSVKNGIIPENTLNILPNGGKENVLKENPINYRTFDLVMKLNSK